MEEQFITYEIALKLKELGFNEECFCTFDNGVLSRNPSNKMDGKPIQTKPYTWVNSKVHNTVITAPLWQQVIDWLREKGYNIRQQFSGGGWDLSCSGWNNESFISFKSLEEVILYSLNNIN